MKLSVITINYNNRDGLRKTIESVVNQTYKDFEYIVIDGGSTDGSVDVIKEYADKIDYWVSEPDKGIFNAMNKGVKVAKGEYLIFMNSGDMFFNAEIIDNVFSLNIKEDIVCGDMALSIGDVKYVPKELTMEFFYKSSLSHQASFIKRDVQLCFPYDETKKIVSDWRFYIESIVLNNASYRKIDLIVSLFDFGGVSNTQREVEMLERQSVLRELIPLCILKDYEQNENIKFRKFFSMVEKTNFRKLIYSICVIIVTVISFFTGSKWVRNFNVLEK